MKTSKRFAIKKLHEELVKAGEYETASRVYELLMNGRVTLGLNDADWNAEHLLEKIGCGILYSRSGYSVTVYDRAF